MNFILHGATDMRSSNYGDFLYGYIIYNYLKNIYPNSKIDFYNPSDYFIKYLSLSNDDQTDWDSYDYAIYIPGGYFGEGHQARFRDNLIQYFRFMIFGLKAIKNHRKILVLAIGAGPINSFLMKNSIRKIISNSSFVTVRDHESYDALVNLKTEAIIKESFDLIITQSYDFDIKSEKNSKLFKQIEDKKVLLVHYNHSEVALKKFANAVNKFIENNDDYIVVVTSDCILKNETQLFAKFKELIKHTVLLYEYDSPYEFTEFLKSVDLVLTCKLHLGVISCMFNKSVIVAAVHPEKTKRFYKTIKEEKRCISVFDCTDDDIYELLETYKSKNITIPTNVKEKAKITWSMLDEEIRE